MSATSAHQQGRVFGLTAIMFGGIALTIAVVHFFGGPFAPQDSLGTGLGEIAADAGKAALRDLVGLAQPAAEPMPWDIDRVLWLVVAAAGAIAVVLSVIALIRHEPRRVVIGGAALGIGAIVFQFAAFVVMSLLALLLIGMLLGGLGIG